MSYIPIDKNGDGIIDQYNMTIRVRKPIEQMALTQSNLILAFDYELTQDVKMKMEGLAFVQFTPLASDKLSASKLRAHGYLNLK